jgi:hypothetical protein
MDRDQFRKAMRLHDIADRLRNTIVVLFALAAGVGGSVIAHAHPSLVGRVVAVAVCLAGLTAGVFGAALAAAVFRRRADAVPAHLDTDPTKEQMRHGA